MKFFIEGNIGSGKSTLVKYLQDQQIFADKNIKIILEPVEEWKRFSDKSGKNILEFFYSDPKRWGYLFQMNAFITRSKLIQKHIKRGTILMERSVYSDRNIFAKNCYEKGLINDIEWKTYLNWFEWLTQRLDLEGDAYIYLRTDPEISYTRIQKRARGEEKEITLEYIKEIHQKHEDWLYKSPSSNILVLDGNIENSQKRLEDFKNKIIEFIQKIDKTPKKESIFPRTIPRHDIENIIIREARIEDADAISHIVNIAYELGEDIKRKKRNRTNSEQIRKIILSERQTLWKAIAVRGSKEQIIGSVLFEKRYDWEKHRGKYGTEKIKMYEDVAVGLDICFSYMGMLSVHPNYQRLGVAKLLIERCEESALRAGSKRIVLCFLSCQKHLEYMYTKAGFKVVGRHEWPEKFKVENLRDEYHDTFFVEMSKSLVTKKSENEIDDIKILFVQKMV